MKEVLLITALVFGLGIAGFAAPFSGSWATGKRTIAAVSAPLDGCGWQELSKKG